ncbi:major facilitator superfamily MFS_1 [Methylobacterium sp. 4-46]|uniref:MFS transporter n=1 Tax=unclassified Methylobacterium TaxID=2615210 RepID=UPI000152D5F5|nr:MULTISPECIES: aromatic acid/H+ symport family MFS transporter [Methylobacterium]ACA15847.1 major facilitator superfamily MFS_1 [Methylobacterium sp. 4-46]WFT81575.1 aromatic acid/H+ symport family MFS transporter [Methylobacterium nodulans]
MSATRSIDVQDVINRHGVSGFQVRIVLLCFLVVAIDGFDTAAIGYIAPALRAQWQLGQAQLAPLFGAGLFGLMVGAFLFGPLADRIGRKAMLVATTAFFGLASLASAWSTSIEMLTVLRFVTGLGLGGAMPNAITLTSEYCPEQRRSFLTMAMFCGFTVGSALGGFAAAHLIADHGWTSVLVLGGILPLALTPLLALGLPESVRFLVLRQAPADRVAALLRRIAPGEDLSGARFTGIAAAKGSPIGQLFQPGLVAGTLCLWLTFFMSLLIFYLLSSWLPTIISSAGLSLKEASLITVMLATGGTVGGLVLGALMDRANPHAVLGLSYLCAAGFVALIGSATGSVALLAVAVFGAGFCVAGSQIGINALAASYYPTASRATGVSWANAVGRVGSVAGSMIGASLLGLGLGLPATFGLVAVPALIAALSIGLKGRLVRPLLPLAAAAPAVQRS